MAQFEFEIVQIPDAAGFVDDAGDEVVEALYHSGCQAVLYESANSGTLHHESSQIKTCAAPARSYTVRQVIHALNLMNHSMKPLCLLISALLSVASATAAESTPPAASLLNGNAILDAYGRGDNPWFLTNIPFFDCPDKDITDIYYYRWWNYRKNIVWNAKSKGWTIHEGGGYGITPCPLGHHLYEGRWLKDRAYITDYIDFWLTGGKDRPRGKEHPRNYANWLADGCYARFLVDYDAAAVTAHLGHLTANYEGWEQERFDAAKGLFKWIPDRDGMEASLAGFEQGEADKFQWKTVIFGGEGYRPSLNSYLYGDARAIAGIADLASDQDTATAYRAKAEALKANVLTKLWDADKQFFLQRSSRDDRFVSGREQIGFFPWAFHLPDDTQPLAQAWKQLRDPQGFEAKYGPTTLERRSPYFLRPFGHSCLWNGPSWPYSTSVTLAALANLLNDYHQDIVTKADYLALLQQYAATQYDPDGQPMVREDHHPDEKRWLAQGANYNHSRYCDLIITGLVGLRPRSDNTLEINPLAPETWDFFCLENVAYHGRLITIVYDRTGTKYGKGAGLRVLIDGVESARSEKIGNLQVPFSSRVPPPLPPSQPPAAAQVPQGDLALNHAGTGFPEPSASFTCPTDQVWQAIDGQVQVRDEPRNRWTCYGTKDSSDWLAIDLGTEQKIDRAVLYFYDDGAGVRVPQSWTLQYWKDTTWVDCPGVHKQSTGIIETLTFPPLLGRKFRAVFIHQKGSASGVTEFALYAPAPSIPKP